MVCDLQVVIEGIVGNGYFGDIAIDDISLTPGCQFAVSKWIVLNKDIYEEMNLKIYTVHFVRPYI